MEASETRKRVIPSDWHAGVAQSSGKPVDLGPSDPKRGMRLASGNEWLLPHADMELLVADLEPGAPTTAQRLGLFELRQAKQSTVEPPGQFLASTWRCNLDVVKPDNHSRHRTPIRQIARTPGRAPAEGRGTGGLTYGFAEL